MSVHCGMQFSTLDDDASGVCCNEKGKGGNWYRSCFYHGQNLNGIFETGDDGTGEYMLWDLWESDERFIKTSRMMFRSVN